MTGLDEDTPLACVMNAGMSSQKVVLGTLATVVSDGHLTGLRSPAVIVIGAVAAFAGG